MFGTSSSGSSAYGGLPRSFLKWESHVLTCSSGLDPATSSSSHQDKIMTSSKYGNYNYYLSRDV